MRIKISERQLNLLLKEQDEPETVKHGLTPWNPVQGSGAEGGRVYPIFSCLMYEPMTLFGKRISPDNYPNSVEYFAKWAGDGASSGDSKTIIVTFYSKDPGTDQTKRWVGINFGAMSEGKKMRTCTIESILNTYECGAEYSINIQTPKITDVSYLEETEPGSGEMTSCSSCSSTFSNLPTGSSFSSVKSFGDAIGKVEFDITTLTS